MSTDRRAAHRRLARILTLVAAMSLALPALADAQDPTDREIIESQRRLDQIRSQRSDLRDEMTRIRTRVTDLSSELSNLERQVVTASDLLGELEYQIATRELQIDENTVELLNTRDRLAERRAVLYRRLRDIYKRGPLATLQVLLSAESFTNLLNRYKYLYLIARHDRSLAEEVANLERLLVARERALRNNLQQLATVRGEQSSEHEDLAALQEQQRLALRNARSQVTAAAQRIEELARDESSLSEMVVAMEARRTDPTTFDAGAIPGPALPTLTPAARGGLDWPVDGRLLYGFGRVTALDGTPIRWNGIGIGAPAGTPVRAVEAASVVLAGPFEGYGPTIVLSHGGGYYTLYLYLRELQVQVGESVSRGQTIGAVGGPNAGEGPHIEFQLRVPGGQAVDPLTWLRAQ
jgi:septal ring factor EnvC (AmiA/AmiB activator)